MSTSGSAWPSLLVVTSKSSHYRASLRANALVTRLREQTWGPNEASVMQMRAISHEWQVVFVGTRMGEGGK